MCDPSDYLAENPLGSYHRRGTFESVYTYRTAKIKLRVVWFVFVDSEVAHGVSVADLATVPKLCRAHFMRIAAIDGGAATPPFPNAPIIPICILSPSGGYGHKRARNKRIGPGGGTRRLHHTPSFADHGAEIGSTNV